MNGEDLDRLLEHASAIGSPRAGFRDQVLRESAAAFVRHRRHQVLWRTTGLAAAAVLIAGVSFLLGRSSLAPREVKVVARTDQGVTVPSELVEWLDAARLFRQLGMEDRMARAVDRASQLLPRDAVIVAGETKPAFAAGDVVVNQREDMGPVHLPDLHEAIASANRIMAQSLGD